MSSTAPSTPSTATDLWAEHDELDAWAAGPHQRPSEVWVDHPTGSEDRVVALVGHASGQSEPIG